MPRTSVRRRSFSLFFVLVEVHLLVFFLIFLFDGGELQRLCRDDLEVGATLRARDGVAFLEVLGIEVEIRFTFWAKDHDYLSFSSDGGGRQGFQANDYIKDGRTRV